jgi:hypothetical protein
MTLSRTIPVPSRALTSACAPAGAPVVPGPCPSRPPWVLYPLKPRSAEQSSAPGTAGARRHLPAVVGLPVRGQIVARQWARGVGMTGRWLKASGAVQLWSRCPLSSTCPPRRRCRTLAIGCSSAAGHPRSRCTGCSRKCTLWQQWRVLSRQEALSSNRLTRKLRCGHGVLGDLQGCHPHGGCQQPLYRRLVNTMSPSLATSGLGRVTMALER